MIYPVMLLVGLAISASSAFACEGRLLNNEGIVGAPVCVPQNPQRIATLDPFYNFQMAASMGLPLVATARSGAEIPGPIRDMLPAEVLEQMVDLGQFQDPDVEQLIASAPDLILGDAFMHGDVRTLLNQIAPTVLTLQPSWKDYMRTIAQAAGREDIAEAQLAAYQKDVSTLRKKLPAGETLSFVRLVPGGFQVYVEGPAAYAPFAVIAETGLKRSAFETVSDDTVLKRPTMEGLLQLTGRTLIYTVGGGHDELTQSDLIAEVMAHPIWQEIPAVKAGRAFEVDADVWMAFGGLHSARAILQDLEQIYLQPG